MTQKSETNEESESDVAGLFTRSDFRLLACLYQGQDKFVSWPTLMEAIYFGRPMPGQPYASFKVAIFKLRKKLGAHVIQSKYGEGHRLHQKLDLLPLLLEIGKEFQDDLSRLALRQR